MIIRQINEIEPLKSSALDGLMIYDNEYTTEMYIAGKNSLMECMLWYPYIQRGSKVW